MIMTMHMDDDYDHDADTIGYILLLLLLLLLLLNISAIAKLIMMMLDDEGDIKMHDHYDLHGNFTAWLIEVICLTYHFASKTNHHC